MYRSVERFGHNKRRYAQTCAVDHILLHLTHTGTEIFRRKRKPFDESPRHIAEKSVHIAIVQLLSVIDVGVVYMTDLGYLLIECHARQQIGGTHFGRKSRIPVIIPCQKQLHGIMVGDTFDRCDLRRHAPLHKRRRQQDIVYTHPLILHRGIVGSLAATICRRERHTFLRIFLISPYRIAQTRAEEACDHRSVECSGIGYIAPTLAFNRFR